MNPNDTAEQLRRLRAASKTTQVELSKETGLSQALISVLENGRQRPTFESLETILEALGYRLELEFLPKDEPGVYAWLEPNERESLEALRNLDQEIATSLAEFIASFPALSQEKQATVLSMLRAAVTE